MMTLSPGSWLLRAVPSLAFLLAISHLAPPLQAQTASMRSGFVAQVDRPQRNPARHAYLAEWFGRTRYLDQFAAALNTRFQIPSQITMGAAECGQKNAFYDPQRRVIVLCYEIADDIVQEFRYDNLTPEQRDKAVMGAISFVLFHEVGHALVDVLDLPITGREEDVADQIATLALANSDPMAAYWAAEYWRQKDDLGDTGLLKGIVGMFRTPDQFADEHSFDEQRFFNVLCWTYGGDPAGRSYLLPLITQARAQRCPGEHRRISLALGTILAGHLKPAGSAPPPPPPLARAAASLAGQWSFHEIIASADASISCDNSATLQFQGTQSGFSGAYQQRGTCRIQGQTVDNPGEGTFAAHVAGGVLSFSQESCNYSARLNPANPARIDGTVTCSVPNGKGSTQVQGSWAAERIQ